MTSAAMLLAAVFAVAQPGGTSLLAVGHVPEPDKLRTALCTGGQRASVHLDGRLDEGTLFRVSGSRLTATATCLLVTDAFLDTTDVVPVGRPAPGARCSQARYPQFQADKLRPVVGCWPIAEGGGGLQVAVIEFARRLSHALASIVVVDAARRLYLDLPAEFNGPGADLWRVGDGGEIHPEAFEIVLLARQDSSYLLALSWAGGDGVSLLRRLLTDQ